MAIAALIRGCARPALLLSLAGSTAAGCQHEPRTDGFAGEATGGAGADDGGTTTGEDDGDSGTTDEPGDDTGTVLDLGGGSQTPTDECVAVTQMATFEDRPVDLIMVGDPETDQVLLRNAVTNLLPQLNSKGIFNTRVVLIAGEAPPMGASPEWQDEFDCGEWDCRGASEFDYFRHIDVDIDPDAVLTEIMALTDEWQPHMRTDTWKHLWISSSRGGDPTMPPEDFTDAFNALGPSYEQFTAHTLVTTDGAFGDFDDLSAQSGGVHYLQGTDGDVYKSFVLGVMESLQGTPLSCEYEIPAPPQGLVFDPMKVNVEYAEGGQTVDLGYVDSPEACAAAGAGWYYDDPAAPTTIKVCPFTCGVFNALAAGASIEIVFGCATVPAG